MCIGMYGFHVEHNLTLHVCFGQSVGPVRTKTIECRVFIIKSTSSHEIFCFFFFFSSMWLLKWYGLVFDIRCVMSLYNFGFCGRKDQRGIEYSQIKDRDGRMLNSIKRDNFRYCIYWIIGLNFYEGFFSLFYRSGCKFCSQ